MYRYMYEYMYTCTCVIAFKKSRQTTIHVYLSIKTV
jgi:hypothetical protein